MLHYETDSLINEFEDAASECLIRQQRLRFDGSGEHEGLHFLSVNIVKSCRPVQGGIPRQESQIFIVLKETNQ